MQKNEVVNELLRMEEEDLHQEEKKIEQIWKQ